MPRRFDEDEGPTQEDVQRFGGSAPTAGYCPDCGAEVSDLADICPHCHAWIPEGAARRPPAVTELIRRWYVFIALAVLAVFLYLYAF